ncbi:MAG: nuclear transport factor 2 family protein [Erythrobacter sp.]
MRVVRVLTAGVTSAAALFWVPTGAAQEAPPDETRINNANKGAVAARVAAVQSHVDAYRSGNLDRFVATFTPDAEVYGNGLVARGRGEIRALYRSNFAPGAPSIRIHGSEVSGEFVYLTIGYILSNGDELCCSYSEYAVTDGKISYLAVSGLST